MGWTTQAQLDELKRGAMALLLDEQNALTWKTARRFIAPDTLEMARWSGLQNSGITPWQAVCKMRGIQ